MRMDPAKHWRTSLSEYETQLLGLISSRSKPDVLELGGGGRPMWDLADAPASMGSYTVNDYDPGELAKISDGYRKACFDVCGDASAFAGQYDVVFSRYLAEHLPDGLAMHRNVLKVLKPGGVAIHLVPKLYASPFVVNSLLPERLAHKLLVKYFPHRLTGKFPAYYSLCRGNVDAIRVAIHSLGYSEATIKAYYGHEYYDRIPGLRQVDGLAAAIAARQDWSWYASYAMIMVRK